MRIYFNRFYFFFIQQIFCSKWIINLFMRVFFNYTGKYLNLRITFLFDHLIFIWWWFWWTYICFLWWCNVYLLYLSFIIKINRSNIIVLIYNNLALNCKVRLFGKFYLILNDLTTCLPISIQSIPEQYKWKNVIFLIYP